MRTYRDHHMRSWDVLTHFIYQSKYIVFILFSVVSIHSEIREITQRHEETSLSYEHLVYRDTLWGNNQDFNS